jgi:LuxR family maltose regulon positive regulatory protein
VVRTGELDGYVASALVHAVAARTDLRRGEVPRAQQRLGRAARLRPLLTYALPYVAVQTLLELGRAYLTVGDVAGAGAVLRQARDILRRRPDLGILPGQVQELRAEVAAVQGATVGVSPLSCGCCRCCPPTSPTPRSLSGCPSRPTRSRPTQP